MKQKIDHFGNVSILQLMVQCICIWYVASMSHMQADYCNIDNNIDGIEGIFWKDWILREKFYSQLPLSILAHLLRQIEIKFGPFLAPFWDVRFLVFRVFILIIYCLNMFVMALERQKTPRSQALTRFWRELSNLVILGVMHMFWYYWHWQ